jgi:glutamate synthase domain-containing protein 3
MSGGMAFVLNSDGGFGRRCNLELVDLEPLEQANDVKLVRELIARHAQYTGSELATRLLCDWSMTAGLFVKVMPRDYKRALEAHGVGIGDSGFGIRAHANPAALAYHANPESQVANPEAVHG